MSRRKILVTMLVTCCLSARPEPVTAAFTSLGVCTATGRPLRAAVNKAMPLAAGLAQGTAFQELTIQIILYSAAPTYFVSILLVLWGLRVPPAA